MPPLPLLLPVAGLLSALVGPASAADPTLPHERYQLDNGLTVILHQDASLPLVVVDTWFSVGSKDEVVGRTGFAHLFEHLMFMGTTRLPGSGFDDKMEQFGGWNNAWTSEDATNYYDVGPRELLPTLLWMEADRLEGLAGAMTQEKLDLQRDVVRNERRQSVEDTPYGIAWEALPPAMYPQGHPYAHSVIGTHEDLQAAQVGDVTGFFGTWYVPANASLVVAGDFDPAAVKEMIQDLYGDLPAADVPVRPNTLAQDLPVTPLVETTDQVQLPATMLSWHTARALSDEDAAMDLLATVLAGGRSSRLYTRLVHAEGLVTEIDAYQMSSQLGSVFQVFALANPDGDLQVVEAAVQAEIDRLAQEGPTAAELERARNQIEVDMIRGLENLQDRAESLNRYQAMTGTPDYLALDLARYRLRTAADLQAAASRLSLARRQTLRVRPEPGAEGGEQ